MATGTLEQRVAALENEITELKRIQEHAPPNNTAWWERIRGIFEDDPDYAEAMRLGREYRASFRSDTGERPE